MYHAGRKNWSGFKAIYRQEQRIANWNTISAKTKPEGIVTPPVPLSAPAWNLVAQIPLVRGSSP